MENQKRYAIVYGPNDRHKFFEALEHAYDTDATDIEGISFTVAYNPRTKGPHEPGAPYAQIKLNITRITGVSHEDSSGQILEITGRAETNERLRPSAPPSYRIEAYYDVSRRKGHIDID